MPANLLSQLRLFPVTRSMTLRKPFLFPSLKLNHALFLSSRSASHSSFFLRTLSSSSSFRNRRTNFSSSRSEMSRSSRDRPEARVSPKSLVDDEADLSDWVGELRTSSFRGKLTSDEDDVGGFGGDSSYRGDENRRRRRDSESEESAPGTNRRDSVRRRSESVYKADEGTRVSNRRVGDNNKGRSMRFEQNEERRFSNRKVDDKNKWRSMSSEEVEGRSFNNKKFGDKNRGRNMSYSNSVDDKKRVGFNSVRKGATFSDDDDDDDEEEDDMDRKRSMSGIDGLLSEEDNVSGDDEDEDEEEIVRKSKSSLSGKENGGGVEIESVERVVRSGSDSYLSETR